MVHLVLKVFDLLWVDLCPLGADADVVPYMAPLASAAGVTKVALSHLNGGQQGSGSNLVAATGVGNDEGL
jgi:hypothetical protein